MISNCILLIVTICIAQLSSSVSSNVASTFNRNQNNLRHPLTTRSLQEFSSLNNIISEITLVLPDSQVSSNGLDITLTDLICYEANVQDIQVTRTPISTNSNRIFINTIGLEVTCTFRWEYEWSVLSLISGSGSGKTVLDPSSGASLSLDVVSGRPPREVSVNDCVANVQIDDLILDGDGLGAIASIINLFKNLVVLMIERGVNTAVCGQVNDLGDKDGALLFVIEPREQTVSYETDTISASSSGVGWLVFFILLCVVYSVGCCFCGNFYAKRMQRNECSDLNVCSKNVEKENSNVTEVVQENQEEAVKIMDSGTDAANDNDVESPMGTNDVREASSAL